MRITQLAGSALPVEGERRKYYRSGVGKLMHLRRWSRPEMANLRDLSRYNTNGSNYANNWSSSRRMRYACIKLSFIRELKEKGVINVNWCKSEEMPAYLFTKNLSGPIFKRHTATAEMTIMIELKGSVGMHFLLITLTMI
jgi:hypothetical protein